MLEGIVIGLGYIVCFIAGAWFSVRLMASQPKENPHTKPSPNKYKVKYTAGNLLEPMSMNDLLDPVSPEDQRLDAMLERQERKVRAGGEEE